MKGNLKDGLKEAQDQTRGLESSLTSLRNTIGGVFAVSQVGDFVRKIMDVRGEVESLQISFETLAGTTKGRALFGDIKSFAVNTPMMMQDLAKGAQTLLGFNIEAEKVMPILKQIGDISMGDAQKFNSLTLAFAQMSSTGKLMGQDLLQMINAGFNPLTVIAEKTGKSIGELKEEMSAGKITVEMVADAFETATAEGGKFHGMLEKQSKGLKGAMSNLEGAWEDALNEMGEKGQGVMVGVIDLTTSAIKNYDKLGTAILTVVAAYGEYKGSLMAIEAFQNMIARQKETIENNRVSELQSLVDDYKSSLDAGAIEAETAATQANSAAKEGNASAIDAEVMAMEKELRAKLAAAEANYNEATSQAAAASLRVDAANDAVKAAEEQYEAVLRVGDGEAIERAEIELATAASAANAAATELQTARKNASAAASQKEAAATRLSTFQTQVDTIQKNANTRATSLWAAATELCTKAMHGLKAAFMSNPFGIALVAITSIIGLLSVFSSETDEASDSVDRFRKKVMDEQSQLDTYYNVLKHVEKGTKSYKTALDGMNAIAREYNMEQISVNDTLEEQEKKYEALTAAIKRHAAEKNLAEAAGKANEDAMNAEKEAMDDLMKAAASASHKVLENANVYNDALGTYEYQTTIVEKNSQHIREITSDTWNMISQDVMTNAQKISAAFAKGPEEGKKAVEEQVTSIESLLRSLGATDQEIEGFHDSLYEYVETSAKGFQGAYSKLERTEAQLKGLANATVDLKDTTNDAIDEMNYEELIRKQQEVQNKIDQLNADEVNIRTNTSQLEALKQLLIDINLLIPDKLTQGTEADLQRRLKEAKNDRDNAVIGSPEWKEANDRVGKLEQKQKEVQGLHAENIGKGKGVRRTSGGGSGGGRSRSGRSGRSRGSGSSGKPSGKSVIDKQREQQRYQELVKEQELERQREAEDLAFETRQHEIDILEESNKKVLDQIQLDFDKRKAEIRRAYEDLEQEKIDDARKAFEANPANKEKVFDPKTVDTSYTDAEKKEREKADAANEQQRKRATEAVYASEAQAMRDFLKEYGSYQQQKLAITEDYAEKMKKAQTEGDRLKLEKERDLQLEQADAAAIKQSIDWGSLFGDFGTMFKEQLEPTLEKLRAITRSEGFKQGTVEEQQLLYELIEKLERSATVWDSDIFKRVSDDMESYQRSMQGLISAQEEEQRVYDETSYALRSVREFLLDAQTRGDKAAMAMWQSEVEKLTERQRKASEQVQACSRAVNEATVKLKASADSAKHMFEGLESAISGLTSGSLKGIGQSLMEFDKLFGGSAITKKVGNALAQGLQDLLGKDKSVIKALTQGLRNLLGKDRSVSKIMTQSLWELPGKYNIVSKALTKALGDSGMTGEILSAVLGIFDAIAENGISGIITSVQDTIIGAVEKLLDDLLSGDIITKPIGNLMEHLNHILDTVTFGGFSSLTDRLGDGDSDKHLEEDLERLSQSNEDLKQAIDNLADELSDAKMSNVEGLYEQQKKNIQEMEKNVQESMARSGAAYTNGHWYKAWTDGHHSSNKKIDEGMKSAEWDAISKLLGKNVRSAGDFWALSSKEMYEVATKLTSEYTHLKDLASDGYKDASEFMDDYITYWKELEEIENAYREKMTGLSFDSARSSFNSLVKDVKNGTKEMLSSVDDMFEDAILNWLMSERYSDRLQGWYEKFSEYMKDGLEKWEADELRTWYGNIFDDMNSERDAAYAAARIDPDDEGVTQSGKAGAFETMTQDQGTKLEGLFTSGQRHWASMDELLGQIADRWGGLADRLGELVENTNYCRKLEGIADDIKTMRRDGIKMR